jgi:hypothetical protein
MDKGRNAITLGAPQVKPTKIESLHGAWVTSGTVTFPILQGGNPAIGALEIPYRDAASEQDALRQALGPLELIVGQFVELLPRLRRNGESIPTGGAAENRISTAAA